MTLAASALVDAANGVNAVVTHLQLHSASPGAAGTTSPVGTRSAIGAKAVNGTTGVISWTNTAFTGLTANQTVTHVSYWTASTGGTFKGSQALTGDAAANAAGAYTVTSVTETPSAT